MKGTRPARTSHRCDICGDHIRYRRNGWEHLRGRHNHPAYHKVTL